MYFSVLMYITSHLFFFLISEYAQVAKMLGNGRLEARCFDGKTRLCHIRGKMRKKVWVNKGDIILLGLRSFQDEKADVIHQYKPEEARELKKRGALPSNTHIEDNRDEEEDNIPFEFTNADMDGSEDGTDGEAEDLLAQPSNRGMMPDSESEEDIDFDEL